MKFEKILERNLGKEAVIRFLGEKNVNGELVKMEGMYFVGEHYRPLNPEDISSIREGKRLDVELENPEYFHGGLLN